MILSTRNIRSIYPLLVVFGCARATLPEPPGPEPGSTGNAPVSAPEIGSAEAWTIVSGAESHTYTSVSHVELELSTSSGISRDTMSVTSRYSLTLDRIKESGLLFGQVDLFDVQAGGRIGPAPSLNVPLTFSGRIAGSQITINPAGQIQEAGMMMVCPNAWSAAIGGVRRIIFPLPQQISRGMTWTDSTSSTACHGSTPVSINTHYTYKVTGEVDHRGSRAILIERSGRTLSTGEGSEGQHRVTVNAKGLATGSFHIDKVTGVLLDAQDEQKTKVIVTSSGRTQEFTQIVREKITLTGL